MRTPMTFSGSAWAVIHHDPTGLRATDHSLQEDSLYEDGWFVDYVASEAGCREFLMELDPVEFEYFLMKVVSSLRPPTIEETLS